MACFRYAFFKSVSFTSTETHSYGFQDIQSTQSEMVSALEMAAWRSGYTPSHNILFLLAPWCRWIGCGAQLQGFSVLVRRALWRTWRDIVARDVEVNEHYVELVLKRKRDKR